MKQAARRRIAALAVICMCVALFALTTSAWARDDKPATMQKQDKAGARKADVTVCRKRIAIGTDKAAADAKDTKEQKADDDATAGENATAEKDPKDGKTDKGLVKGVRVGGSIQVRYNHYSR